MRWSVRTPITSSYVNDQAMSMQLICSAVQEHVVAGECTPYVRIDKGNVDVDVAV